MKIAIVTGANKGIGLEFCRQYRDEGFNVIGFCRSASGDLRKLGVEFHEGVDLAESAALNSVSQALAGRKIDLLINNAGILFEETIANFSRAQVAQQLLINSIAPIELTISLLPNLVPGSKVAMISSRMGSISDNKTGGYYGYRMSKAALNAGAVSLARDLAPRKILVGIYHPGFVRTAMTSQRGDIDAATAAGGIRAQIENLTADKSGEFSHGNGEPLPW